MKGFGRETEVLGENLRRRHFVHHKSHLPDTGVNLSRRGRKPATNRFSYVAANIYVYREMDENGDLLADSHDILNRWKNCSQLLNVHKVSNVLPSLRQTLNMDAVNFPKRLCRSNTTRYCIPEDIHLVGVAVPEKVTAVFFIVLANCFGEWTTASLLPASCWRIIPRRLFARACSVHSELPAYL
jgi:hypothetical protein